MRLTLTLALTTVSVCPDAFPGLLWHRVHGGLDNHRREHHSEALQLLFDRRLLLPQCRKNRVLVRHAVGDVLKASSEGCHAPTPILSCSGSRCQKNLVCIVPSRYNRTLKTIFKKCPVSATSGSSFSRHDTSTLTLTLRTVQKSAVGFLSSSALGWCWKPSKNHHSYIIYYTCIGKY